MKVTALRDGGRGQTLETRLRSFLADTFTTIPIVGGILGPAHRIVSTNFGDVPPVLQHLSSTAKVECCSGFKQLKSAKKKSLESISRVFPSMFQVDSHYFCLFSFLLCIKNSSNCCMHKYDPSILRIFISYFWRVLCDLAQLCE